MLIPGSTQPYFWLLLFVCLFIFIIKQSVGQPWHTQLHPDLPEPESVSEYEGNLVRLYSNSIIYHEDKGAVREAIGSPSMEIFKT